MIQGNYLEGMAERIATNYMIGLVGFKEAVDQMMDMSVSSFEFSLMYVAMCPDTLKWLDRTVYDIMRIPGYAEFLDELSERYGKEKRFQLQS